MHYHLRFTKVTGAGNDFVLIDDRDRSLPIDPSPLARLLCSRNFGVGADGILLVWPSTTADFAMGYYNADGSTGGMCGNGGRCIAHYAYSRGIAGEQMRFEAFGHTYRAVVTPLGIRLFMKDPAGIRRGIRLDHGSETLEADYVNTGAPHAVLFVESVEALDVAGLGRWIRYHEAFAPDGTNANFVEVTAPGELRMRTYERGVEAETLACGTGSVASALIYQLRSETRGPVAVRVRSGSTLVVHIERSPSGGYASISLEGPAYNVFDGNGLVDEGVTKFWLEHRVASR